jgi:hypothetical protein
MKLWKVNVVHELVVRAKNPIDARFFAKEILGNPDYDSEIVVTEPVELNDESDLPQSWNENCIPWGERTPTDMTIGQLFHEKQEIDNEEVLRKKIEDVMNPLPGFE